MEDLEHALASLLNSYCAENASNTPDWVLAQYLLACLAAFDAATQQRESFYGRDPRPSRPFGPAQVGVGDDWSGAG